MAKKEEKKAVKKTAKKAVDKAVKIKKKEVKKTEKKSLTPEQEKAKIDKYHADRKKAGFTRATITIPPGKADEVQEQFTKWKARWAKEKAKSEVDEL